MPQSGHSKHLPAAQRRWTSGKHAATRRPRRIFGRRPSALIAPRLEILRGSLGEERAPRGLKACARLLKGRGRAACAFAGPAARIGAAAPLSFGSSAGVADACGDRADDHVTIVDAPSLLGDVGIDAAGEGGHAP